MIKTNCKWFLEITQKCMNREYISSVFAKPKAKDFFRGAVIETERTCENCHFKERKKNAT